FYNGQPRMRKRQLGWRPDHRDHRKTLGQCRLHGLPADPAIGAKHQDHTSLPAATPLPAAALPSATPLPSANTLPSAALPAAPLSANPVPSAATTPLPAATPLPTGICE
ncbi:MAG TPA: hypothetical protein VKQ52_01010, partial [Puia sp.]|nr:hypothetical protein [Puia sp.]